MFYNYYVYDNFRNEEIWPQEAIFVKVFASWAIIEVVRFRQHNVVLKW